MKPTIHRAALMLTLVLLSACSAPTFKHVHEWKDGAAPGNDPVNAARMGALERKEKLTAIGYAVVSVQNHRNPGQQRLLAIRASKLDAYRALAEQVYGQQLDATTNIGDMTVLSDSFRARVEGVIYGAVLVSITPVGDDLYETTLSLERRVVDDLRALYIAQLSARPQ